MVVHFKVSIINKPWIECYKLTLSGIDFPPNKTTVALVKGMVAFSLPGPALWVTVTDCSEDETVKADDAPFLNKKRKKSKTGI